LEFPAPQELELLEFQELLAEQLQGMIGHPMKSGQIPHLQMCLAQLPEQHHSN
jgi:hypothetical protein